MGIDVRSVNDLRLKCWRCWMRSWMLALALVLASCIEDGSKELGESCWTREDCADDPAGMVCDALVCGWPDRTRELGE